MSNPARSQDITSKFDLTNKVNTEIASLLIIDPCMLFTHDEWQGVLRKKGSFQDQVIKGLGEKLGLGRKRIKFLREYSAVVGTGRDSTFLIGQPKDAPLPIVIGWPGQTT